jgi:hypothetical protein
MPHFIVKIKDKYIEWSTIVDAPISHGMSLGEFKKYYQNEYGNRGIQTLQDRLDRVEEKGTSEIDADCLEDTVSFNRAGLQETELTVDEIYRVYCLGEQKIYGRVWWEEEE